LFLHELCFFNWLLHSVLFQKLPFVTSCSLALCIAQCFPTFSSPRTSWKAYKILRTTKNYAMIFDVFTHYQP
jgi:hypothetical protein